MKIFERYHLVAALFRRQEPATLDVETIQLRDGRRVLADLEGKGRRTRTATVPVWVKQGINVSWMTASVNRGRSVAAIDLQGWQAWREPDRRLGRGRAIGEGDWHRANSERTTCVAPLHLRQPLQEERRRPGTN
jgi:hypothetical protein